MTAKIRTILRILVSALSTAVYEPRLFRRRVSAILRGQSRYRSQKLFSGDWTHSPAAVRKRLGTHLLSVGETFDAPAWKGRLADTLIAWNADEIDHEAASREVRAIASDLDPREAVAESFFAMSRAASSSGLFVASHDFVELGYSRIALDATESPELWDRLRGVLVDVHRRRIDSALDAWHPLRTEAPAHGPTRELHAMVDRYLSAIEGRPPQRLKRDPLDPVAPGWVTAVTGRRVLVDGPGPKDQPGPNREEFDLVAEVVNFSVLAGGATRLPDIIYTNKLTWSSRAHEIADRYPYVSWTVVKGDNPGKLATRRTLRGTESHIGGLFLAGHPNMIPIVCLDLVTAGVSSAYLTGVNFYASEQRYATGTTEHYGARLKQTSVMAGHTLTENRAFVANLADAGLLDGDDSFRAAIGLDDRAYLKLLDDNYGRPRL
jgi:hypothetical protein